MAGQRQKFDSSEVTIVRTPGPARGNSILPPDGISKTSSQSPPPQTSDPLIHTFILQYEIIRRLGGGGMGAVYLARDTIKNREVALKLMSSKLIIDHESRTRFSKEGHLLSQLRHPNIVDIYERGEFEGKPFFAMEYLHGIDLAEHLKAVDTMPLDKRLSVLVQLCDALAAVHAHGFIHRDVKLENIIILETADGSIRIKLIDFGLAKMSDDQVPEQGRLTQPGICMGTPEYMAPELSTGNHVDHRIDVYSTGVVMYYLFCNNFPFTLDDDPSADLAGPIRLAMKHITEELVPPSAMDPTVPQALSDIVVSAMKKKRDERLSSVTDIRDGILAYAASVGLTLTRVPEDSIRDTYLSPIVIVKHRIPKYLWWVVGGVAIAAAGVSRMLPVVQEKQDPPSIAAPAPVELIPLVDLKPYPVSIQTQPKGASVHMLETAADGTRWLKALPETPYTGKLTGTHTLVLSLPGHLPIYIEVDANNNVFTDLQFQRITPTKP